MFLCFYGNVLVTSFTVILRPLDYGTATRGNPGLRVWKAAVRHIYIYEPLERLGGFTKYPNQYSWKTGLDLQLNRWNTSQATPRGSVWWPWFNIRGVCNEGNTGGLNCVCRQQHDEVLYGICLIKADALHNCWVDTPVHLNLESTFWVSLS
jgi:hypothetical protein